MFPHGDVDHGRLKLVGSSLTYFLNHGLAHILRKEGTFFSISMIIYYHVYLQQYDKYLEVDLIGSKVTNCKHEKMFVLPGPWIETKTFES